MTLKLLRRIMKYNNYYKSWAGILCAKGIENMSLTIKKWNYAVTFSVFGILMRWKMYDVRCTRIEGRGEGELIIM